MKPYHHVSIESRWQKRWREAKTHEPDLKNARKPFYNLMMFPYPSAEGLHIGNMYAFTGADIYGRLKRMQGYDVFEPIGLDGFGIHSENYALKTNQHPMELSKKSEANFYRQLEMLGNSFAWDEKLETYDPEYYKWTQWIFAEMFNRGLAYRKKAPVNWCPSCKTVLADEQAATGTCERCGTAVEQRELAQWFFKITDYAERLLNDLEKIDWSEKVKIAQRNWIGKSEGAEINFELKTDVNFVLLHGYRGSPKTNFHPWMKKELEKRGYRVQVPALPNSENPRIMDQVEYVRKNIRFDERTILVGHSLGAVIALKVTEELLHPVQKLILAAGFITPNFKNHPRPFAHAFNWKFNFKKIQTNAREIVLLRDPNDSAVKSAQIEELHAAVGGALLDITPTEDHICGTREPEVLRRALPSIKVFTTRPDTIFGATFLVLGPENEKIKNYKSQITNWEEVERYIEKTKQKNLEARLANKNKTGVELQGFAAINPATQNEIPIWVADYVLGGVAAGAIMGVPAHDERDYEFATRHDLPIKKVVAPRNDPHRNAKQNEHNVYTGAGVLCNSYDFNGLNSEQTKWKITEFVNGQRKTNYRLRDWLISRQRYWGPPIPLVFCEACKKQMETTHQKQLAVDGKKSEVNGQESDVLNFSAGELENPGWHAVPIDQLPVTLPYIKEFHPTGTGVAPLATNEKFYKTACPKCGNEARRETDVSDTFLDSAWYYYRYPSVKISHARSEIATPWNTEITTQWLPVHMYTGGAEHSVLHLLYTRFITKVFHDWGLINFDEPFIKFRAHGLIIKDGAKMSKSKGNVVNPDKYIQEFGADALRMYLMFLGPFERGGDFQDRGILGIERFLKRAWNTVQRTAKSEERKEQPLGYLEQGDAENKIARTQKILRKTQNDGQIEKVLHQSTKKITDDIENLKYNTAISQLMILLNEFEKGSDRLSLFAIHSFLKLLNPFAPHIAQELWSQLGHATLIDKEPWPQYDERLAAEQTISLIVQINGKARGTVEAPRGISQEEAARRTRELAGAKKHLEGKTIKKIVFVPDKLINFVITNV